MQPGDHTSTIVLNLLNISWRIRAAQGYNYVCHYSDVLMGAMGSQITNLTIVYSTVYSGADQRKHQSPASLVFMRGIHRRQLNSPHKGPVTRRLFPFDDVIMAFPFGALLLTLIPTWISTHKLGKVYEFYNLLINIKSINTFWWNKTIIWYKLMTYPRKHRYGDFQYTFQ